ncbi:MAG: hypothetical protein ACI4WR_08350 [Bulleidia sp.]
MPRNGKAVIIANHGRKDTVSLAYEDYPAMKKKPDLLEMLADSEEDICTS